VREQRCNGTLQPQRHASCTHKHPLQTRQLRLLLLLLLVLLLLLLLLVLLLLLLLLVLLVLLPVRCRNSSSSGCCS
jgi:Flp pilus assembly protein TadB